jgi:chromate transporter
MSNDTHRTRSATRVDVDLAQATALWWRIGWLNFGGPAGQIALLHREVVERRGWLGERQFLHALNYCMLLPGPEALQLAIYIGWLLHRTIGGLIAGLLFVLPGCLLMLLASALYVAFGAHSSAAGLLFGIKAAVLAIVIDAVIRISQRTLKTPFLRILAALASICLIVLPQAFIAVLVAAALLGFWLARRRPNWLASESGHHPSGSADQLQSAGLQVSQVQPAVRGLRRLGLLTAMFFLLWLTPALIIWWWLGSNHVWTQSAALFGQAALLSFGGAYAVLAYVGHVASEQLHWLSSAELQDGLAVAESTPGPLVLVLQFIGFIAAFRFAGTMNPWLAAAIGALISTWMTLVPSFFFIFAGAPYVESLRSNPKWSAALTAIGAVVVAALIKLALWFAIHTLFTQTAVLQWRGGRFQVPVWDSINVGACLLAAVALYGIRWRALPSWACILLCGAIGVFATLMGWL